jgi:hypothetical protein
MGRPKVENSRCSPQLDSAMRAPSEAHGTGARAWWKSIARIDRICQRCFFCVCLVFAVIQSGNSQVTEIDPDRICSDPVALFFIGAIGSSTFPCLHAIRGKSASDPSLRGWCGSLGADPAQSGPAHEDARSAWGCELSQAKRCSRSRDAPEDGERLASGASDRICTDRIWNSSTS